MGTLKSVRALATVLLIGSAAAPVDAQDLGTNLLVYPSFELGTDGLDDWEAIGVVVQTYGSSDEVPSTNVSTIIGGGGRLLRDVASGSVRQTIPLLAIPKGAQLFVAGHLGGYDDDGDVARMVVDFSNGGEPPLASETLGPVTSAMRNEETILLRTEALLEIPAGTTEVDVSVQFAELGCCFNGSSADELTVMLVTPPSEPVALPLGEDVMTNGGFEGTVADGVIGGSPFSLTTTRGWFGADTNLSTQDVIEYGTVAVPQYGVDPAVPDPDKPLPLGANPKFPEKALGGRLLRSRAGDAVLAQRIDLTGHETLVDKQAMEVRAVAWLGGIDDLLDSASLRLRFLDAIDKGIGAAPALGPVTSEQRVDETTLFRRTGVFDVPAGCRVIEVAIVIDDVGCCIEGALADGIQLFLEAKDTRPCDAGRVQALGILIKRALGCHAKAIKQPAKRGAVLEDCLQKAVDKHGKRFTQLAVRADKLGQACCHPGPADALSDKALAWSQEIVDAVVAGMDPAVKVDVGLRIKLVRAVASLGKGLTAVWAKDVKNPNPVKLADRQDRLLKKFAKKTGKAVAAAEKKGVTYDGQDAASLASDVFETLETLVEAVR